MSKKEAELKQEKWDGGMKFYDKNYIADTRKYSALLLNANLVDIYWSQCEPLIQESLDKVKEETNIKDIYESVMAGRIYVFVAKCDDVRPPHVGIVVGASINIYPRYSSLQIDFLGGSDLTKQYDTFWRDVAGWARLCNIKYIEALVDDGGMTRILEKLNFHKTYNVMRQDLDDLEK